MLEYALACLGSNILYTLTNYGVISAMVRTTHSVGAIVIYQSTTGASLTTATTVVALATTTPLVRGLIGFSQSSFRMFGRLRFRNDAKNCSQ